MKFDGVVKTKPESSPGIHEASFFSRLSLSLSLSLLITSAIALSRIQSSLRSRSNLTSIKSAADPYQFFAANDKTSTAIVSGIHLCERFPGRRDFRLILGPPLPLLFFSSTCRERTRIKRPPGNSDFLSRRARAACF